MSKNHKKKLKPVLLEQGGRIPAPTYGNDLSDNKKKPAFSLEYLAKTHCVSCCSKDEKAAFADRLKEMSCLTWEQIGQAPRKGQGYEKIPRTSLKVPVPLSISEDVKFFLSFRCIGNAPMLGFRSKHILYIVWVDPKFSVYDHE